MSHRRAPKTLATLLTAALVVLVGALSLGAAPRTATASPQQLYCSVPAEVVGYFGPDSDTWQVNGVTDSTLVYVGEACRQHDICYGGLAGVSRLTCDEIFVAQLRDVCYSHFDVGGPFTKQSHCLGFSRDYYNAVRWEGASAYHGPINN